MTTVVTGQPDLSQVKAWLGLADDDIADDVVLQESLDAALAVIDLAVTYPTDDFGEDYFSDSMVEAAYLITQRLAARRNSPEGVVGLTGVGGDFVGARVPGYDPDVQRLLAPYLIIPVA